MPLKCSKIKFSFNEQKDARSDQCFAKTVITALGNQKALNWPQGKQ